MKLKATLLAPRVDFGAFRKALQEQLGDAIARAAFEWLAATTAEIPVWSGASLSTFQHLASEVSFQLSVNPVSFADRISLGLSNSTGSLTADASSGKFEFSYSTSLAHLIYNEFNNANISPDPTLFSRLIKPGPYQFQIKGAEAFRRVANDVELPAPTYKLTPYRAG